MSCNCKTSSKSCDPCAFCTPPGVRCLPVCTPPDPCDEKVDLCCVTFSGSDYPCSDVPIHNGDPLCTLLINILSLIFPVSQCCALTGTIILVDPPPASVCGPCVLVQTVSEGDPQTIYYKDCNGTRTPLEITNTITRNICTSDITSIDLVKGSDIYYMQVGECSDGICTKMACKCYLIMNGADFDVNYTYLPCNYNVNNPSMDYDIGLARGESVYVCSVGIPSICKTSGSSNNTGGPTVSGIYVIPLNNLNCIDDECTTQTAYCYDITATGSADVDYVYLDYENFVVKDTAFVGDPAVRICAQPGSIVKASTGTLVITPINTNCTNTGGDCFP